MTGDRIRRPYDTRRGQDARAAAEKAFKAVTTKQAPGPVQTPAAKAPAIPGVREQVTLRIDQDVLERFRETGPGWQDRINAALRKALEP
ncbi:BrnA antitoxin family protein [Rhodoplanes roseus]|uniref:BrnA antitoxin of type II toxin-antitoxin system n=1 Tax=Rhodoplanes roseus TaxID=29409 RepID=A0A327L4U4_9BRAD|nr:BrnA antitoxin family protein [Rhodoplanes roseus]RAI44542.1 hypothetical protein CH341_08495 [Rhodoplanes roseus]